MRIISSYKQGQCIAYLVNILNALKNGDEIERLDAVKDVADIADIIGGEKMVMDIRDIQFDQGEEHE